MRQGGALQAQQLLTEKQAAAMLSVSHTTLATWRCKRRYSLPWVKLGRARAVRYRLSDVQAFIAAGLVGGDGTRSEQRAAGAGA
jgi:predicted DNA-binding transcriptional regulator AlpA